MTIQEIMAWAGPVAAVAFGGGITGLFVAISNRKIGLKTVHVEEVKTTNITWDSIVDNLQGQLNYLSGEITALKQRQTELEEQLGLKERLILRAIAHIGLLELLVPPNPVPDRPEGLD